MKKALLTLTLLWMCLPVLGFAQEDTCWDCTLGIFDSEELLNNYGTWDTSNPQKTFYLGITYDPTSTFDGLTGIELSVYGLPSTFLAPTIEIRDGGIKFGDTIEAPEDTTLVGAQGGWNVVWSECQPNNRVLVTITMISFDPIPDDTVIWVLRRFPPNEPTLPHALFTACDFPLFTKVSSRGGCYVLNPTVEPGQTVGNCTLNDGTAVATSTWSGVKALYR